ncbi:MAG: PIN domain-containing protein [Chloroflexi bacterium]|nr:PIN domain-containing protein [Chloroflexota bacterium]
MPLRFLDTNVLIRYFTRDDEEKARQALALLARVERGDEKVITSPMVIFETVFTLQKGYQVPRSDIRRLVSAIIALRGLQLQRKNLYYRAFDLYVDHNISFADAYNAAYMEERGATDIYTWDTDFDKLEGVAHLEPQEERLSSAGN